MALALCPGDPVLVRRCGVGSVRRGSIIVVAGVSEGVDVNGVVFRERETFTEWLPPAAVAHIRVPDVARSLDRVEDAARPPSR
jgi:hypothetical protein